ncbi:MAG: isoaspartyl peptidase/L-asparaginase family protein [Noviherbaspirillum sp.]
MAAQATIAIHGGAGTISRSAIGADQEKEYHAALASVLLAGQRILEQDGSAIDAVTEAVRLLEECPLFNAGKGSVFTADGTHELDASIMDGASLAAGAVAGTKRIRNPVLVARTIMEQGEYVMLCGEGAERFATQQGFDLVEPGHFHTDARHEQWLRACERQGMALLDHDAATLAAQSRAADTGDEPPLDPERKMGTVGAVALDLHGNLAAAASTGGITNKRVGRIGDTPVIGAGCYANNKTAAVAATGTGEAFMRAVAAFDIAAQIEYAGRSLIDAAEYVVMKKLPEIGGRGGLIAVDAQGNLTLPFNTEGMYRGYARIGQTPVTLIYR